ncbi:MAG: 50S ribosomal protein L9 [Pseudomonadota bacterium]|nr:50S ribosomal protein L9 [Pseudomonadota bacterium]
MEVILTKVSKLGNIGDKVNVKGGYARNYLIPTGGAVSTTAKNLAYFDKIRAELEKTAAAELKEAQLLAADLQKIELVYPAKVSEGESIFGSVGVVEVLSLINKTHPSIERRQVHLIGGAARELGEYKVTIQCHRDVVVELALKVVNMADK